MIPRYVNQLLWMRTGLADLSLPCNSMTSAMLSFHTAWVCPSLCPTHLKVTNIYCTFNVSLTYFLIGISPSFSSILAYIPYGKYLIESQKCIYCLPLHFPQLMLSHLPSNCDGMVSLILSTSNCCWKVVLLGTHPITVGNGSPKESRGVCKWVCAGQVSIGSKLESQGRAHRNHV